MQEFLKDNWEFVLTAIILPLFTWFAGRRHLVNSNIKKSQAEVTEAELVNVTANFKVYQDLLNDLETRFKARINDLEQDLEKMKEINEDLRKAVARQEKYINKLLLKIGGYEKT